MLLMYPTNENRLFPGLPSYTCCASAKIAGDVKHPQLGGRVEFFQTPKGVLVAARIHGLPDVPGKCGQNIFGFHIHAGDSCTGTDADPFADSKSHYNPNDCPHPSHAGDLPPLFGVKGEALMIFLTGRFTVKEIIGKTIIIHADPDDFTTQPSGNAGQKIACGVIVGN